MFNTFTRILTTQKVYLITFTRRFNLSKQRPPSFLRFYPFSSTICLKSLLFSLKPRFQTQFSTFWGDFTFSQQCCLCNEVKNESIPESDDRQCLQQQQQQQQQKWKIPIDQLYDEAQQCEYSKDFVRARRLYTEIVQRAEVSEITIEALNRLGILAQQEGDLDASQSFFQQALQLNPNSGFVYNNLANIFVQRGDIDSAISCYRAALAQQKDNVEIYLNLASFLLRTEGRRQEAIEVLREAVSIFPTNSQLHSYLAGALQEEDQLDAAITHHKLALNYASEPSVLLIMKVAMALIERKDYDAARVYVQQALQLPVVNNEPHKAMALLLKNEGKSQESIEFLYRAIEIDPHDASSYYQLAVVHLERGDSNKAIKFLVKAVKEDAQFAEAYNLLGGLLHEHGKLDEAEKCLRRAVELKPNEWAAHLNLARLLETKNMPEAAKHHRQIAIQLNPELTSIIS